MKGLSYLTVRYLTMIQKNYFTNDYEEIFFSDFSEFKDYLKFRKENDIIIRCQIKELSAAGIENIPLFAQDMLDKMEASYEGYKYPCEKLSYDEKEVKECIDQTGLFLIVPFRNRNQPVPTSEYAVNTILQRSDDFCGTMSRFEAKPKKKVLPVSEKAVRLTRDFELYDDDCLVLIRDNKVRAVHSRLYDWLDCEDLDNEVEKMLKNEHPDFSFEGATATHEYLTVDYMLNNELMEESLRMQLNDTGSNIKEVKAGIQFLTSDVGVSAVKCNIILKLDDEQIILTGVSMEHKNGASIERFAETIADFGAILKEQEEKIEELGNIDIINVPFVVEEITKNYTSIFPGNISEQIIDELKIRYPLNIGGSAIDCYIALNKIINRHKATNNVSLARYIMLSEQVAQMIHLPFDKIAEGGYFKKD